MFAFLGIVDDSLFYNLVVILCEALLSLSYTLSFCSSQTLDGAIAYLLALGMVS